MSEVKVQKTLMAVFTTALILIASINGSNARSMDQNSDQYLIIQQFNLDLRESDDMDFQIYQKYLIIYSKYSVDITKAFLQGREEYVASIGATAMVALAGSAISEELLAINVQEISSILSGANPQEAIEIVSTMMAAMPKLSKEIVDGVRMGAPDFTYQIAAVSYELSGNEDSIANEDDTTSLSPDSDVTNALSESQIVSCLSAPCP